MGGRRGGVKCSIGAQVGIQPGLLQGPVSQPRSALRSTKSTTEGLYQQRFIMSVFFSWAGEQIRTNNKSKTMFADKIKLVISQNRFITLLSM